MYLQKHTFEIKPADASKLVGVIASRQYTGYSLEIPSDEINLKLGDDVIDAGDNFKLTYGENRSIGQGTVTLTPKNGNFTGTKTLHLISLVNYLTAEQLLVMMLTALKQMVTAHMTAQNINLPR